MSMIELPAGLGFGGGGQGFGLPPALGFPGNGRTVDRRFGVGSSTDLNKGTYHVHIDSSCI
jgi:hypothetical protein